MPINPYYFDVIVEDGRVKVYEKKIEKNRKREKKNIRATILHLSFKFMFVYFSYLEFRVSSLGLATPFFVCL